MTTVSYIGVRNPQWLNQAHTYLKCEVNFSHLPEEWVEFSCVASGDLPHTHEIFQKCVDGEFGAIAEFEAPTVSDEERLTALRIMRGKALEEDVDPLVSNPLRWNALSEEKQQEWEAYRQALLDFPATSTATLVWNDENLGMEWQNLTLPTKPE